MNTQAIITLIVGKVIRYSVTAIGGGVGGVGMMTGDQQQQLAGAIAGLIAISWSIYIDAKKPKENTASAKTVGKRILRRVKK